MKRSPTSTQPAESPTANRYPTYPPEVEARRSDYETIARAFNALIEVSDRPGRNPLDVDLPFTADAAPPADLLNTIQDHLYRLHLDIDWFNPETMMLLYVEMRMQCDYWRWKHKQDRPDEQPTNPTHAPRGITALYTRLGALMGEVMDHDDCSETVSNALGEAYVELRNRCDDHIPTNLKDEFASLAQRAA